MNVQLQIRSLVEEGGLREVCQPIEHIHSCFR
jgi:hypothetical protein